MKDDEAKRSVPKEDEGYDVVPPKTLSIGKVSQVDLRYGTVRYGTVRYTTIRDVKVHVTTCSYVALRARTRAFAIQT